MQWILPNMMLIAGDGRNVGKTTFAKMMIRQFAKEHEVIGIKTSPHMHELSENMELISKTGDYIVAEEKGLSLKDSSLLLQAGAKRVFFIMANQESLKQAFSCIEGLIKNHLVIAESGGLSEMIMPGVFFFILKSGTQISKKEYLQYQPILVQNGKQGFDFNPSRLTFRKAQFLLAEEEK